MRVKGASEGAFRLRVATRFLAGFTAALKLNGLPALGRQVGMRSLGRATRYTQSQSSVKRARSHGSGSPSPTAFAASHHICVDVHVPQQLLAPCLALLLGAGANAPRSMLFVAVITRDNRGTLAGSARRTRVGAPCRRQSAPPGRRNRPIILRRRRTAVLLAVVGAAPRGSGTRAATACPT